MAGSPGINRSTSEPIWSDTIRQTRKLQHTVQSFTAICRQLCNTTDEKDQLIPTEGLKDIAAALVRDGQRIQSLLFGQMKKNPDFSLHATLTMRSWPKNLRDCRKVAKKVVHLLEAAFCCLELQGMFSMLTYSREEPWQTVLRTVKPQNLTTLRDVVPKLERASSRIQDTLPEPVERKLEDNKVVQYVTLDQAAAIVNRSKQALRKKANRPTPSIQGRPGQPHEWDWEIMRPWLENEFGKKLPARYPAHRAPRN